MRDKLLVLGLSSVIVLGALYLKKKVFIVREEKEDNEPEEKKDDVSIQ